MNMPEGARLLALAASRLRASFESIREGVRHRGEQGRETQDSLIDFLNTHLPKRFRAASGYILDAQNNTVSGHVDVLIYDQQDAYVFAPAETSLIVPNDNVAAVIEVKSALSKAELESASEKIRTLKAIPKLPERPTDFALPNSSIQMTATRGILFAYSSTTSLDAVWSNLRALNVSTDSDLWIDEIVVLDKGTIAYSMQLPVSRATMHYGGKSKDGSLHFPVYIIPKLEETVDAVLPTFMARLSMHLIHYRRRPALRMDALMPVTLSPKILGGYWFDTQGKLSEVPQSQINSDGAAPSKPQQRIVFYDANDEYLGQVEWLNWSNGHVLAFRVARLPIAEHIISTLLPYKPLRVHTLEVSPELLMTSLLPGLKPPDFGRVFELLSAPSVPLRAKFFDWSSPSSKPSGPAR
jgi:hypothetical protein